MIKEKKSILAVIVTYNPDNILEENIKNILHQVDTLVLIDNCSKAPSITKIAELKEKYNFILIKNSENKGIATALNQGLALAAEGGYDLFLTMDQDTALDESCVKTLIDEMERYGLESIGPAYDMPLKTKNPRQINFLITSGNLTKTKIAIDANGYDDWMFIDGVDVDFSLKIRALGYKIAQSQKARMKHSIGEKGTGRFLFFKIPISVHSHLRYFYMARNNIYLQRKYRKVFPFYCFKLRVSFFIFKLKILFFYCDKSKIFKSMRRGEKDARKYIKL